MIASYRVAFILRLSRASLLTCFLSLVSSTLGQISFKGPSIFDVSIFYGEGVKNLPNLPTDSIKNLPMVGG